MAVCGGGCMGFVNVDHRAPGHRLHRARHRSPRARWPSSPIPARSSRRCCAPAATSDSPSPCRRGQELVTTTASYLDYALAPGGDPGGGPAARDPAGAPASCGPLWRGRADQGVAVVALTVGASAGGRAMVAAHSGALAGADGAWEALFHAYGVIRVQ